MWIPKLVMLHWIIKFELKFNPCVCVQVCMITVSWVGDGECDDVDILNAIYQVPLPNIAHTDIRGKMSLPSYEHEHWALCVRHNLYDNQLYTSIGLELPSFALARLRSVGGCYVFRFVQHDWISTHVSYVIELSQTNINWLLAAGLIRFCEIWAPGRFIVIGLEI